MPSTTPFGVITAHNQNEILYDGAWQEQHMFSANSNNNVIDKTVHTEQNQ